MPQDAAKRTLAGELHPAAMDPDGYDERILKEKVPRAHELCRCCQQSVQRAYFCEVQLTVGNRVSKILNQRAYPGDDTRSSIVCTSCYQ